MVITSAQGFAIEDEIIVEGNTITIIGKATDQEREERQMRYEKQRDRTHAFYQQERLRREAKQEAQKKPSATQPINVYGAQPTMQAQSELDPNVQAQMQALTSKYSMEELRAKAKSMGYEPPEQSVS